MLQPTLHELYDVKDSLGRWFEARVVNISSQKVKVHYSGWASVFDETISGKNIGARFAPHQTQLVSMTKRNNKPY